MKETLSSEEEKASWHPGEEGRMTEAEAHDEANLLRAKIEEWGKGKPSAASYDYALEAVEELKQAAKNEPEYQKVLAKIMRVAARPVQELFHALDGLATRPELAGDVEEWHRNRLKVFNDAARELQILREKARKFE